MLIHALKPQSARLSSRMGEINETRLMPLERTAVSSWSALKRPNTSSAAVNMPIGSAKTSTHGNSRANASATPPRVACRLINSARISFSTLASTSTNVNTATVISSVAKTCRVKYRCSVFINPPGRCPPVRS